MPVDAYIYMFIRLFIGGCSTADAAFEEHESPSFSIVLRGKDHEICISRYIKTLRE